MIFKGTIVRHIGKEVVTELWWFSLKWREGALR
jgi:hypothetical protein